MFKFEGEDKNALIQKFKQMASSDQAVATAAKAEFAQAVETPLRKVILSGDILNGIFTTEDFTDGQNIEYPLDLLTPGQEKEFYAYVIPSHGQIPMKRVEADYLKIPTYNVGNSIDCTLRFIRDANWPVISRMIEVLEAGFVKKMNDDGWQTIMAAATDRNILINDPNAAAGQFTPRLIALLKTFMRRNGGGNTGSLNRSRLTDIYLSPEAHDDMRSWGLDLIPDAIREQIYRSADDNGELIRVYNVDIHSLDEFGEGQEYQNYFTTVLGGSMAGSDLEIGVGLDRQRSDSFVMPIREALQLFEDNTLHRRGLFGMYGKIEYGVSVLDSRRTILFSL